MHTTFEDVVTLFKQHHGDVAELGYQFHELIKQQAQRIAACRFKQNNISQENE